MKKALLTAVVLGLAACASTPHTEPTRLLLSYDGAAPIASTAKATLVVRAVTVPDYLDRRNLVYRSGAELKEYPDAQWAERPAKAITRYLTQALSAQRSDYAVQALTTASGVAPDAALTLVIDRFEAEQGGTVQLRGSWTLTAPGKILASGRLDADATTSPTSASTTVAAMQQALSIASANLAKALPQAASQ